MMGTVNGTAFNVQMKDASTAATFAAKREYRAIKGGFAYTDFEVAPGAGIVGVERSIRIEMENADVAALTLFANFAVQETGFPAGLLANLETQWEWETGDVSCNAEGLGWTGTVLGYVRAARGTDSMVISSTVPVAEYEIDE